MKLPLILEKILGFAIILAIIIWVALIFWADSLFISGRWGL